MEEPRTEPCPEAELNPAAQAAPEAAGTSTPRCRVPTVPSRGRSDCTRGQRAGQKSGEEERGFEEGSNKPFLGRLSAPPQSSASSRLPRQITGRKMTTSSFLKTTYVLFPSNPAFAFRSEHHPPGQEDGSLDLCDGSRNAECNPRVRPLHLRLPGKGCSSSADK